MVYFYNQLIDWSTDRSTKVLAYRSTD